MSSLAMQYQSDVSLISPWLILILTLSYSVF